MNRRGYLYLAILAGAVIVLGKLTWDAWFRLVVPATGKISEFPITTLAAFSSLAGFASFFAPCAFPLLPGYISYYIGTIGASGENMPSLRLGIAGGLGIAAFFSFIGGSLIMLGTPVTPYLAKFKPFIALAILLLGLAMLQNYTLNSPLLDRLKLRITRRSMAEKTRVKGVFLFGVAYAAASMGCTLPVFGSLLLYTLSIGSWVGASMVLIYSLSMGSAMLIATLLISRTGDAVIKRLAASAVAVKKASGIVLILVGVYLLSFYIRYGM